jgi:hypothetical protein
MLESWYLVPRHTPILRRPNPPGPIPPPADPARADPAPTDLARVIRRRQIAG